MHSFPVSASRSSHFIPEIPSGRPFTFQNFKPTVECSSRTASRQIEATCAPQAASLLALAFFCCVILYPSLIIGCSRR